MAETSNKELCLSVRKLKTSFFLNSGRKVQAVRNMNFDLYKGETLGVVGESGSGKTVMAKSILRLITPPGKIESGKVMLGETDLMRLTEKEMLKIRGQDISMIFQEPLSALNPSFSIQWQREIPGRLFRTLHALQARQKFLVGGCRKGVRAHYHEPARLVTRTRVEALGVAPGQQRGSLCRAQFV